MQVVIISGETGCGKTTQVPQFVLEAVILAKKVLGRFSPAQCFQLTDHFLLQRNIRVVLLACCARNRGGCRHWLWHNAWPMSGASPLGMWLATPFGSTPSTCACCSCRILDQLFKQFFIR
jgi:hypothetical protein